MWARHTAPTVRAVIYQPRLKSSFIDAGFFAQGRYLFQVETSGTAFDPKSIVLRESSTGKLIKTLEPAVRYVKKVQLSPNEQQLLVFTEKGYSSADFFVWEIPSGRLLFQLQRIEPQNTADKPFIQQAQYLKQGEQIAGIYNDRKILVWDARTGALVRQLSLPLDYLYEFPPSDPKDSTYGKKVYSALDEQISPDEKYLLSGEYYDIPKKEVLTQGEIRDPRIHLWSMETGKKVCAFNEVFLSKELSSQKAIGTFSTDGQYLLLIAQDKAFWYKTANCHLIQEHPILYKGDHGSTPLVKLLPNNLVLLGEFDHKEIFTVWNPDTKEIRHPLQTLYTQMRDLFVYENKLFAECKYWCHWQGPILDAYVDMQTHRVQFIRYEWIELWDLKNSANAFR